MNVRPLSRKTQSGIVLLDALIAVVIFSIGILGMVSMQSNAISYSSDAKYRTDASMIADKVMGEMWVADPATLATQYSAGGAAFNAWNTGVVTPALPQGVGTIVFDGTNVAVTLTWTQPGTNEPHTYTSATQIVH